MGLFDKKFNLKLDSNFKNNSAKFNNMMQNLSTQLNVTPELNFDASEFDPNAGRQEAYDKRWNNYLNNLAKDNKKINVKKARKVFDNLFNEDWENSYIDRVSNAMDNSLEKLKSSSMDLVSKNYEDNNYVFDGNNWVPPELSVTPQQPTPQQPTLTPSGHDMNWWLKEAQKVNPNFKSIEDVMNWQRENGLAEVDGKFGKDSLAKWKELQKNSQSIQKEQPNTPPGGTVTTDYASYNFTDGLGYIPMKELFGIFGKDNQKVEQPQQLLNGPLPRLIRWLAEPWNKVQTNYNAFKNGGNINKFKKGGKKMGFLKRRRENRQKSLEMFNDFKTKIYGDAELDDNTMRLLQRVWKLNPEFIRRAAEQKAPQAPKKSISSVSQYVDAPAMTHIDRVVSLLNPNYTPDFSSTGTNRAAFNKAFGIADKAGLKSFNWNGTTYNTKKDKDWKWMWDGSEQFVDNWLDKEKTLVPHRKLLKQPEPEYPDPEEEAIVYNANTNLKKEQPNLLINALERRRDLINGAFTTHWYGTSLERPTYASEVKAGNIGDPNKFYRRFAKNINTGRYFDTSLNTGIKYYDNGFIQGNTWFAKTPKLALGTSELYSTTFDPEYYGLNNEIKRTVYNE